VENLHPLSVRLEGNAVSGVNPGWSGQVRASDRFAALLLIRNSHGLWWGKPEVAASGTSMSMLLHPNGDGTAVQFIYTLGYGGVHELSSKVTNQTFEPVSPMQLRFEAGVPGIFCTIKTEPAATFEMMFLSHANVYAGRTGVWRPHKQTRAALSAELAPALCGPRVGSYSYSGNRALTGQTMER
jgi:hypothetical protein